VRETLLSGPNPSPRETNTIVIIGCGPSGASCALRLKNLTSDRTPPFRIIVYEGKPLETKRYFNQCLGVLSPPLDKIMEQELGVPFPWPIIQRKIEGYVIHSDKSTLSLTGKQAPSYACRRVEFDNYLFQKVREAGVEIIPARVTDIDFLPDCVMVYSEGSDVRADLVIGAFGLDDGMARVFERVSRYHPPKFLSSVVTKLHPGELAMERFGSNIHAFLIAALPLEFGAITPKGNHLSINIAGERVDAPTMDRFLGLPAVRATLPEAYRQTLPELTYFKGKFPTLPAKAPLGERYIMVGDAAGLNRPFKGKGINSAVTTGLRAAEAIAAFGLTRNAFEQYIKGCCELTDDIPYGRMLRAVANRFSKYGLLDGVFDTARKEPALQKAMFNIVSGQETYKKTWQEARNVGLLLRTFWASLRGRWKKGDHSPAPPQER
jgi:flavin-dependent dehydrogenase